MILFQYFNEFELNINLFITYLFIFSIIFSALMRYATLYFQTIFSYSVGADLVRKSFSNVLHQAFSIHQNRNSSDVIATITYKISSIIQAVIISLLNLFNSFLLTLVILLTLYTIDKWVTVFAFSIFGISYIVILIINKKRVSKDAITTSFEANRQIRILQEGLGEIRDILLSGNQMVYVNELSNSFDNLKKAQQNIVIRGGSPKFLLEAMGLVLIASLAYYQTFLSSAGIANIVPVLGALALGAQRILPLLQQAYASIVSILGCQANLLDVLGILEVDINPRIRNKKHFAFKDKIEFKNVNFSYNKNSPTVLNDVSLSIVKGFKYGIIGKTGGGKSTLLDLLMGLIKPDNGSIYIDGVELHKNLDDLDMWQNCISHVPQNIFLKDSSLKENIALGIPIDDIDLKKVVEACNKAKISDVIENWEDKYDTIIGEGGSRLSGGQQQRIGIARALYNKSELILFDEATSSLDSKTESDVMDAIDNISDDVTVIIIAHRTDTLKKCDYIFEVSDGNISLIGNYKDLLVK